jgi:Fe-S oxidoreductase
VDTEAPIREVIEEIKESGGDAVKYCYQCGKCDSVCPWNRVINFSMRKLIREATFGFPEIDREEVWRCTTCGKCPQQCPRDVKQIEDMVALRRIANAYGVTPAFLKPVRSASASLAAEGNPFGEERAKRADWAEGLSVKPFTEGMEILYFPCCFLSYDGQLKKVAQATAGILNQAGVDFGILGAGESCCGESIRKTGHEALFKQLARENIKSFIDHGVKKILVSSPHCYHAFKNDYAGFKVNFEVVHISQYLGELINEGRLKISKEYHKKVTYHDPCYLGRHNGIYDAPRGVLKRIPGLELQEMEESRENSLCCGMGGGRIWIDTKMSDRFSNLRIKEAGGLGAEVLVTACPYCLTALEDSRLGLNYEDVIQVKEITEIIQEVIR